MKTKAELLKIEEFLKPQNPWAYSSRDGYLVMDGRVRIYGFSSPPLPVREPPRIARRTPVQLELKPGRYSWCTCGHSKDQPFCDHSHRALPENQPWRSYKFQVHEPVRVELCRCKRTQNPPFCDCKHSRLNESN